MNNNDMSTATDNNFERLKDLLREMFQLDRGDLDFGIYRIMNMKSTEVENFLNTELLPQVKTALEKIGNVDIAQIEAELEKARADAAKVVASKDIETAPNVMTAKAKLLAAKKSTTKETDVYKQLHNFFARYYDAGDFMSLRRYKADDKEAYLIPYNGEEVRLHWANADQYYIKTAENYQSYIFILGDGQSRVRFKIAEADAEKDNVKSADEKNRRFILAKKDAVVLDDEGTLVVSFDHRPLTAGEDKAYPGNATTKQNALNEFAHGRILEETGKLNADYKILLAGKAATEKEPERTILSKHLTTYVAKNEFDYFIHKDLNKFLTRELDFYLKNEVLFLDDVNVDEDGDALRRALTMMKAIRLVGGKIIAFLAQLENFQKKLWLKKKFVLETNYCITLDRIPKDLYASITENAAQVDEWIALFAIDELAGFKKPLSVDFLTGNPFLVLDTRHFDADFIDRLLAALSDDETPLEDQMDGLLIHSENFQALNLLQERYREQVKCIYIDPPYNTDAAPIIYKNGYKHSSFCSLMANRMLLGKLFLSSDGCQIAAIDDTEFIVLAQILDESFEDFDRNVVVVNHHPAGAGLEGTNISATHEYAIFSTPKDKKILHGDRKEKGIDEIGFIRTGTAKSNLRIGRPKSFYAVLVDSTSSKIMGAEPPPEGDYPMDDTEEGLKRIYPRSKDGTERVWRRSYKSFFEELKQGNIICKNGKSLYLCSDTEGKHHPIFSNWTDKKYNAGAYGTAVLKNIFNENEFSYPKSIHTVGDCLGAVTKDDTSSFVLDYFAGSGTTGHAVINLNREDDGQRKYILVEMGQYFDTVTKPRIQKVIYSKDWKDGKPVSREGSSHFFKYIRLESYEDTLDSLHLSLDKGDLFAKTDMETLKEGYKLRYALGHETADSATLLGQDFDKPDAYNLSVVRDGTRGDVNADLAETFNYLLGLKIATRRRLDGVLAITGTDLRGKNHLMLWRDAKAMPNDKLEAWFKTHSNRFGPKLDTIYVNGDQTLNAIKKPNDKWTAQSIEPTFRDLMFKGLNDEDVER